MGKSEKTEGKIWRHHIRHECLLGLTYRGSRSSWLDETLHCYRGQGANGLLGGGDKDYVCAGVRGQRLHAMLGGIILRLPAPQRTKSWSEGSASQ